MLRTLTTAANRREPMRLGWLFGRRARRIGRTEIVFYTRCGCHLCDAAWQRLQEAKGRFSFDVTAVDVDGDPELVRRYGECVPVVVVNGKVRFRGRINRVLLERLLRAGTH